MRAVGGEQDGEPRGRSWATETGAFLLDLGSHFFAPSTVLDQRVATAPGRDRWTYDG